MAMTISKMAARYVPRRFSSSGRILSEEEKAAENVYIKKIEKEKLEKLARQGPKPEEKPSAPDIKTSKPASSSVSGSTSSTSGVSTDKYRNYAVVAGVVTGLGALGWYFASRDKKTEEVQD